MDLDTPQFTAARVADLASIDLVAVHTWTSRGLVDPYRAPEEVKRGRGQARTYSLRDALRFYLAGRLHEQYRTPLPQAVRICEAVFGSLFNPQRAAFVLLEESTASTQGSRWCADVQQVAERLAAKPTSTVINVKKILDDVTKHAEYLLKSQP
jgi:hypothetical protein